MLNRSALHISSKIYRSASLMFYVCRFLGIAPYSLKKQGQDYALRWSFWYTIYSYAVCVVLVGASLQALIHLFLTKPGEEIYAFSLGVFLGYTIMITLVLGAPWRTGNLFKYLECLKYIDSALEVDDSENARCVSLIWMTVIFFGVAGQEALSNYFMYQRDPANLPDFLPHSVQQTCAVIVIESQVAHLIYSVERRIKILNQFLSFETDSEQEGTGQEAAKTTDEISRKLEEKFTREYGVKLSEIYCALCDAVDCINNLYLYIIVVLIMFGLLRVTENFYFLIFMIFLHFGVGSITTEALWVCNSIIFNILIIAEPCDRCLNQISNTQVLVCKLLDSRTYKHPHFKKQVRIFAKNLKNRPIVFSICGLGTLNHKFLTVFMDAVITYLVIIIQFEQTFQANKD